ncbi:DUF5060 domain-containing protein [Aurantiacibacter aquimixticola]|uniref:DUF5060 domain-containing protein n=1 Tax=Aurantiacibacter aquimixticola TaxID=1958945 RepID=UPI0014036DA0|nr:DUF5060 domain-containing protein [Aurantiacibacter aquimixticola]
MPVPPPSWTTINGAGQPTARHEAGFVEHDGKLYLIGGRGVKPTDIFDPVADSWSAGAAVPVEMHHFQPVSVGDEIWIVGAMTGGWPNETPLPHVWRYLPGEDRWEEGIALPQHRLRGGGGVAIYGGRLWWAGGITDGHVSGSNGWLDSYDLETGEWRVHADAPHRRDHFQLLATGNRLYLAGGRRTGEDPDSGFEPTEPQGDMFDIANDRWLPTDPAFCLAEPSAGMMAAVWDGRLIFTGGESGAQQAAHARVAVYDPATRIWSALPALNNGRHGTGLAIHNGLAYVASGAGDRGGGPELTSIEALGMPRLLKPTQATAFQPVTLDFLASEYMQESDPATFTDHRLMVRFTSDSGDPSITVRGFFAGDGDAADSSADGGHIWRAIFTPPAAGNWRWTARFAAGDDIAISTDFAAGEDMPIGRPAQRGSQTGVLAVAENRQDGSSWTSADYGPLRVVDGRYRLPDQREWIKSGANSPENLLGFDGFDGTYRTSGNARDGEADSGDALHTFAPHLNDWQPGDPQWGAGEGRALVGLMNYLASVGVNSQYFLTWNVEGDGKDVWPYTAHDTYETFDVSKLGQWNRLFDHMQARGIALHVVLQETENELLMDGGNTERERRLYMAEMVARFAHHNGLIWNLGEENGPVHWRPEGQTDEQRMAMIDRMSAIDPYNRPLLLHTHSEAADKDEILTPLLGYPGLDGLSFQVSDPELVASETAKWLHLSREAGNPWVITMDEIGPWQDGAIPDDEASDDHARLLQLAMQAHLEAGGSGVEWYFGAHHPHNDLTAEDLRSRDLLFRRAAEIRRAWEAAQSR